MPTIRAVLLVAVATLLISAPASAAVEPRIWNGHETTDNADYPWTVALVSPSNPGRAFCGGTLIAPNVVLTAAHCTTGYPAATTGVVAGLRDISAVTSTAHANYYAVTKVSVHAGAETDDDSIAPRRDISLLTLDAPVSAPAAHVGIADAAELDTAVTGGADVDATGWGLTEESTDTVPIKRAVTLDLVGDGACSDFYDPIFGEFVFSPSDQVCAIRDGDGDATTPGDNQDTCNGDSGGPLVLPTTGAPDVQTPADWELVGATSWGIDCAYVDEGDPANPADDVLLPGIYARVASDGLRPYAAQATDGADDALEQPEWDPLTPEEEPAIITDSATAPTFIACAGNPLNWTGGVDQVDYLIRRVFTDAGDVIGAETVNSTGFYVFDEGDAGDQFICEAHGRRSRAGGYGVARSGILDVPGPAPVEEPEPQVIHVPYQVPGPPVIVPGPSVTVPDPRDADQAAPRVTKVARACTTSRVCTFTVTATDNGGVGVKTISAQLTALKTRRCRRDGRLTTCASSTTTVLRARAVAGAPGTFRVTTSRLKRGVSYAFQARAVDRAGNVQESARRLAFRLK